jgi:methylated-DNA-[protein]-cysteine S-methyltransferase
MNALAHRVVPSPLGNIVIAASAEGVTSVEFVDDTGAPFETGVGQAAELADRTARQLDEYFAGTRREFDVTLAPQGTEFQRSVWMALRRIPYANTVSYKQQATWVGNPKATRAVGSANGRNPIAIIVPCHRVIGSDGRPTGYASGIDRKLWLLDHERGVAGF